MDDAPKAAAADMLSFGWFDGLIAVVCLLAAYWYFFMRKKDESAFDANAIKSFSIE